MCNVTTGVQSQDVAIKIAFTTATTKGCNWKRIDRRFENLKLYSFRGCLSPIYMKEFHTDDSAWLYRRADIKIACIYFT